MDPREVFVNRYHDTTKRFQGFMKLMLVWKGSVFKLIWHDLLAFIVGYYTLSGLYRGVFIHDDYQREWFHFVCLSASRFSGIIPISFLTGFYVTQVVSRYWDQFVSLPWPDRLAYKLVGFIPGRTPYHLLLRRTVMRYINLSTVLVFRLVSAKVHARFPDYKSLVEARLLLPHEAERLSNIDQKTNHETTWTPILWSVNLLQKERSEGRITVEAPIFASLISAFDYLDNCNRRIFNHGWVNFPLAYTQVATLSVYSYLFAAMFAHQFLEPPVEDTSGDHVFEHINVTVSTKEPFNKHTPDFYVPIFTLLEFIGYMGWIKVAETLLNPWGDDDEDFQINYLIDRNLQLSYLIVDEAEAPMELMQDPFAKDDIAVPSNLRYLDDDEHSEGCWPSIFSTEKCGNGKRAKLVKKTLLNPLNKFRHRRAYRCQSTRSRLRSLNENRRPVSIHSKNSKIVRRVHRQSEVSHSYEEKQQPNMRIEDAVRKMTAFHVDLTGPTHVPKNLGINNLNKVTFNSKEANTLEEQTEYVV